MSSPSSSSAAPRAPPFPGYNPGYAYKFASHIVATNEQIQHRVGQLAVEIAENYKPNHQLPYDLLHPSSSSRSSSTTPTTHNPPITAVTVTTDNDPAPPPPPVSMESPLVLVCVLKGSYIFTADLARALFLRGLPTTIHCMQLSSYGSATTSSGNVRLLGGMEQTFSLQGRHVLVIEDILDSGRTLNKLKTLFASRDVASLEMVTLLDKPEGRVVPFSPKYIGFSIKNEFVVGYGLDYDEMFRDLPDIVVLKKDVYAGAAPSKSGSTRNKFDGVDVRRYPATAVTAAPVTRSSKL